jgi:hypothetical protein
MLEPTQRKFTPEEHAQLTALQQRQAGRELDARLAASEMALRQWCVEQAVTVVKGIALPPSAPNATINVSIDTMSVAKDIFDFVTAPLKPEVPK